MTTDCARGCLLYGLHVPLEGREEHPEGCEGCAPKPAEVGRYCLRCAMSLRDTLAALPDLIGVLYAMPEGRPAPVGRSSGDLTRRPTKVDQASPSPAYDAADEAARWCANWAFAVADERHELGAFCYRPDGIPTPVARSDVGYLLSRLSHLCAAPYVIDLTDEARRLRHRLVQATGADAGDRRLPVRCPACGQRSLVRPNGTEDIECRNRKCSARDVGA